MQNPRNIPLFYTAGLTFCRYRPNCGRGYPENNITTEEKDGDGDIDN